MTGAASTEVEATPMADVPGAPTNLRPTAGDEQVTLSWTAPSDNGGEPITRYEYQHRVQSSPYPDAWTTTGGTQTTVTVYDLENGTTYDFKVRAVNRLISGARRWTVLVTSPLKNPPRRSASPLRASTSVSRCPGIGGSS